jgi:hypothetical protein
MSCSTVFLQEDGFRSKLAQGCHTKEACSALVDEASTRIDHCKNNTVGYVRCEDASADLGSAKAMLAKVEEPVTSAPAPSAGKPSSPTKASAMAGDEPTREQLADELGVRGDARQEAEHQRQQDLDSETQSGRCTEGHAEHLRRVLDQVVGFWRDQPLQVVAHKLVVLKDDGVGLGMPIIVPGEYHVFAIQPDGRIPQLSVRDGDGYEVTQGSEWLGYFGAGGTGVGGRARRLQWSDPSQAMPLKVAGQGCAMIVVVQRVW